MYELDRTSVSLNACLSLSSACDVLRSCTETFASKASNEFEPDVRMDVRECPSWSLLRRTRGTRIVFQDQAPPGFVTFTLSTVQDDVKSRTFHQQRELKCKDLLLATESGLITATLCVTAVFLSTAVISVCMSAFAFDM